MIKIKKILNKICIKLWNILSNYIIKNRVDINENILILVKNITEYYFKNEKFKQIFLEQFLQEDKQNNYHIIAKILEQLIKIDTNDIIRNKIYLFIEKEPSIITDIFQNFDKSFIENQIIYFIKKYPYSSEKIFNSFSTDFLDKKIKDLSKKIPSLYNDIFLEQLSIQENKKIAFQTLSCDANFIYGGVSRCQYSTQTQILSIHGWFLPTYNYDAITLHYNNIKIGSAILRSKRFDVYLNYPIYPNPYSGWYYIEKLNISLETKQPRIEIRVWKKQQIIFKTTTPIEFTDYILNNSFKNITHEELLLIKKDTDIINVSDLKEIKKAFIEVDKEVRNKKNKDLYIEKIKFGNKIETLLLFPHSGINTNYEDYKFLLSQCSKNKEFYKKYLAINNYERIKVDFEFIIRYIKPCTSILDIGAIPPLLESLLLKHGYKNITVIDPNATHFSNFFNQNSIQYINDSIFTMNEPTSSSAYDLVILTEVLEHLNGDICSVLEKITRYVKPNGLLYITTPNLRSISGLYAIIEKENGLASKCRDTVWNQYTRYHSNGYYGHIREYTSTEVVKLFKNYGFELIDSLNYHEFRNENTVVIALEKLYPSFGLFGKYLLKKIKE